MKDVSERLKMERLSRGWTLQDVSDRTRINITILRALESGKTGDLGSPLTVEALLGKYSAALGEQTGQAEDRRQAAAGRDAAGTRKTPGPITAMLVMGAVFAALFLAVVFWRTYDTGDLSVKSRVPAVSQPATISSTPPKQKPKDMALQRPAPSKTEKKAPALPSPGVAAGPVSSSKQDAVPPTRGADTTAAAPKQPAAIAPEQPAAVAPKRPAAVAPKQPAAAVSNLPGTADQPLHSLEMAADQRTWIQVVIDGKKTETELLQPGQIQQWRARNKVDLVVGNGGGVHILWDGKPVKISRTPGRVIRLTLTGH